MWYKFDWLAPNSNNWNENAQDGVKTDRKEAITYLYIEVEGDDSWVINWASSAESLAGNRLFLGKKVSCEVTSTTQKSFVQLQTNLLVVLYIHINFNQIAMHTFRRANPIIFHCNIKTLQLHYIQCIKIYHCLKW